MGPLFLAAIYPFSSLEEYSYVEFTGSAFRKCSRFLRYLVRQWILVASVYGLCLANRDRYAQCKLCLDQPVEIPQVQFLVRLLTRSLLCCDSCLGVDSAENCGGSAVAVGAVLRVDVPILMQLKFLQFYENVEVPQFPFLDRVVQLQLCFRGVYVQCKLCKSRRFHRAVL